MIVRNSQYLGLYGLQVFDENHFDPILSKVYIGVPIEFSMIESVRQSHTIAPLWTILYK